MIGIKRIKTIGVFIKEVLAAQCSLSHEFRKRHAPTDRQAGVSTPTDQIVAEWIDGARDEVVANRRNHRRQPFFRPVAIRNARGTTIQGFIRDISPDGISLVHSVPVDPGCYALTISISRNQQIDVKVRLTWCEAHGGEWRLSGGAFYELSLEHVALLQFEVKLAENKRRFDKRYPFFRPVTVTTSDTNQPVLTAFSRDISDSGVGLLHGYFLEPQHVALTIPRTGRPPAEVSTEITWCKPCGAAFISGGRFRHLLCEESPERIGL